MRIVSHSFGGFCSEPLRFTCYDPRTGSMNLQYADAFLHLFDVLLWQISIYMRKALALQFGNCLNCDFTGALQT